ncbi:MAG TPA: DUF2333 family protein [Desulfobacterales bacterium]|jgi:hypothetical protein|nr:DUF2333 family protein [Desulfobacterales bacterium]
MDPFKSFAAKRILLGILILGVVLWGLGTFLGSFEAPPTAKRSDTPRVAVAEPRGGAAVHEAPAVGSPAPGAAAGSHETPRAPAASQEKPAAAETPSPQPAAPHDTPKDPTAVRGLPPKTDHDPSIKAVPHGFGAAALEEDLVPGILFVDAIIAPLDYELNKRFWGWRPNDILNFTDNVNNFQLGVLEVTRRAVTTLTERISRTGTTAAFDPDLENAMNWLMIKADGYWFPSPESKYNEALDDLRKYRTKLERGKATFYTRTDNLIPLLAAFEDLLGSCDENLVKFEEKGGDPVSFFDADDYFYYAQGVASAMAVMLEAIHEEYFKTMEARRATEILHHAIEWCHYATKLSPWIITDSKLDGILANHRANLAAPISHARFYLGVLVKTLST